MCDLTPAGAPCSLAKSEKWKDETAAVGTLSRLIVEVITPLFPRASNESLATPLAFTVGFGSPGENFIYVFGIYIGFPNHHFPHHRPPATTTTIGRRSRLALNEATS